MTRGRSVQFVLWGAGTCAVLANTHPDERRAFGFGGDAVRPEWAVRDAVRMALARDAR